MSWSAAMREEALQYNTRNLSGNSTIARTLEERARIILNSSPEPSHEIVVERLKMDMAEKERVGLTFNRTVTESMADRWHDLECLNAQFLQDVVNMEEQIKDDITKCEREMETFIANRAQVLTLTSSHEQMAGLAMHINFFKKVLESKIASLRSTFQFLQKCTESMGFNHPTQIIDRYESLRLIFDVRHNSSKEEMHVF
ncbi:hypothetical protein ElyMa_006137400 [Elysia marginata]|uniref:Uncharacterized protein n=1 Tax=Elysia marginata TaxID=1093978 RepID=A0AAV4GZ69_9GAST|nr:hypothetical protein ElyMa_006137400 [Elysia marginata]